MNLKSMVLDVARLPKHGIYQEIDKLISGIKYSFHIEKGIVYFVLIQFSLELLEVLDELDDKDSYIYLSNRLKDLELYIELNNLVN